VKNAATNKSKQPERVDRIKKKKRLCKRYVLGRVVKKSMTYLDKMIPGQRATVVGFTDDSPVARRLLELGLVPGREITYLRNAPFHDPIEIMIGHSSLSLRHAEAALVAVELED